MDLSSTRPFVPSTLFGFSVDSPGVFSTLRRVGSHAYVDEVLA